MMVWVVLMCAHRLDLRATNFVVSNEVGGKGGNGVGAALGTLMSGLTLADTAQHVPPTLPPELWVRCVLRFISRSDWEVWKR
jgi:hypothetical protein